MSFHFRTFTPDDREVPIIEVLRDGTTIFDLTLNSKGAWEIGFHEGAKNVVMPLADLEEAVVGAKRAFEQSR